MTHAMANASVLLILLVLKVAAARSENFGCGPFNNCQDTRCRWLSAPPCKSQEMRLGPMKYCGFFSFKRMCCAQYICTTRNDIYTQVFEDTPYTMAVLDNDEGKTDPGLNITRLLLKPLHGSADIIGQSIDGFSDIVGQSIVYRPFADFHGNDTFVYCAQGLPSPFGKEESSSGMIGEEGCSAITVIVHSVNDPPVLITNSTKWLCPGSCVMTLDSFALDKDDGDFLTIGDIHGAKHGLVEKVGPMTIKYTSKHSFVGVERLSANAMPKHSKTNSMCTYQNPGNNGSVTLSLELNVTAANSTADRISGHPSRVMNDTNTTTRAIISGQSTLVLNATKQPDKLECVINVYGGLRRCCPPGMRLFGDKSACRGEVVQDCALYGNDLLPRCIGVKQCIINPMAEGHLFCCPNGLKQFGDGSACKSDVDTCALYGNAGMKRCNSDEPGSVSIESFDTQAVTTQQYLPDPCPYFDDFICRDEYSAFDYCIRRSQVCDGRPDCKYGLDEPNFCDWGMPKDARFPTCEEKQTVPTVEYRIVEDDPWMCDRRDLVQMRDLINGRYHFYNLRFYNDRDFMVSEAAVDPLIRLSQIIGYEFDIMVTSAWSSETISGRAQWSRHYTGHALDLIPVNDWGQKTARDMDWLAGMAIKAGWHWVWNEGSHVHVSLISDHSTCARAVSRAVSPGVPYHISFNQLYPYSEDCSFWQIGPGDPNPVEIPPPPDKPKEPEGCFAIDSLLQVEGRGDSVSIAQVAVDDRVLAASVDGFLEYSRVVFTHEHVGETGTVKLSVAGHVMELTRSHLVPVYTDECGLRYCAGAKLMKTGHVKVGDMIYVSDHVKIKTQALPVLSIEIGRARVKYIVTETGNVLVNGVLASVSSTAVKHFELLPFYFLDSLFKGIFTWKPVEHSLYAVLESPALASVEGIVNAVADFKSRSELQSTAALQFSRETDIEFTSASV